MTFLMKLMINALLLCSVVGVTFTITDKCKRWQYPSGYNLQECSPCLKCPGSSACTRSQKEMVKHCVDNVEITSYPTCKDIAHCGYYSPGARHIPTCPPIAAQSNVNVYYLTEPQEFKYRSYDNHMFAVANISCDDGSNSTIIECQPKGTWNGSSELRCKNHVGAEPAQIKVPTSPNPDSDVNKSVQGVTKRPSNTVEPDPPTTIRSGISSTGTSSRTPPVDNVTPDVTNQTVIDSPSGDDGTDDKLIPVVAVCVVFGVCALIIVSICIHWKRKRRNERNRESGVELGVMDKLLVQNGGVHGPNGNAAMANVARTQASGENRGKGISENGSLDRNGDVRVADENGNGQDSGQCQTRGDPVEDSFPAESQEALLQSCRDHDRSLSSPAPESNLDNRPKESIPQKHCAPNCNLDRPADEFGETDPCENDERSVRQSSDGCSTCSENQQDSEASSQTEVKKVYSEETVEHTGEDEGLPSKEPMSEANPTNLNTSGSGYYHDPTAPPAVVMDNDLDDPTPPLAVESAADEIDDAGFNATSVVEENSRSDFVPNPFTRTTSPPRNDNGTFGSVADHVRLPTSRAPGNPPASLGAEASAVVPAGSSSSRASSNNHSGARRGCPTRDTQGEAECNTKFRHIKDHPNFQSFINELKTHTDIDTPSGPVWVEFLEFVCEVTKDRELKYIKSAYVKHQTDTRGSGEVLYGFATGDEGRDVKLYRLVDFGLKSRLLDHRDEYLEFIGEKFPEHRVQCKICGPILSRYNYSEV